HVKAGRAFYPTAPGRSGAHTTPPAAAAVPFGRGLDGPLPGISGAGGAGARIIIAMRTGLLVLLVVAVIVVGGLIWAVGVNNQLVRSEQLVNEKWAQVQNVYQRRADLIPNLVETVKGFAAQERTVLAEVTLARDREAGNK